ncbi:SRPBCC family protein [Leadbetterella byssophila]|jgi:hypothetical protein|uniref:Polyketide cyclase/dehydrase n=1 Tax=Leadbetterella byssophila (strain DSM 17132 / JCM 16389 / KACC 11308 / NBRC 106382 / 4M15) TaxID=649349 RepID=E4RVZ1_LEAB4|nr:SRPBCC family protein [Leadbetterella byssophila]ADQ18901.1 Polyketide cyclase/dehydrase [Leadbetterella byssophila DSM 17132]
MKKFLLIIVALIALLLLVAAFLPKDFMSERSVVINRPSHEIYEYVKYVQNQDHYGVWNLSDPEMKRTTEGVDGTVGFKYSWDGKKVGKGSMTITELVEGKSIVSLLDFGFGEPAKSHMILDPIDANSTKVTWGLSGRSPWPLNLMSLFFDVGKDFEEGLQNLKGILEK